MDKPPVDQVLAELDRAGGRILCDDLCKLLESLGFYFKSKKTKGHKLYFHDGLINFRSGSFNCDHSKNPPVKAAYVQNVRATINEFRDELNQFLEGKKS
jgi:hypothetical protein